MNPVYITEQGAVVRQSSKTLVITKDDKKIMQIPILKMDRLLLFGNVQLTTQAINLLLSEGIDVAFLTLTGRLRGRLVASESKNVILRLAQYERYLDNAFQIDQAREIVRGKLNNGRVVLLRHMRSYKIDKAPEIDFIEKAMASLAQQESVESLMGSEGISTAAYFRAYGRMFRKELTFKERTRRPPKDPVNAILSLGYTLLTNEILSLVTAHGFDPYIGFLHGIVYGRPSLALDIVEEFRHPLIDRFTLNLFNMEVLKIQDFHPVADNGVYLTAEGMKKYFKAYEEKMRSPLKKQNNGPAITWRAVMKNQVRKMANSITDRETYHPFKVRQ